MAEKTPTEIGNLMLCAQTIQKFADSCGDHAALLYDEKFRRWRQRDPAACPWHLKNVELYQEAVVLGLDFKLKTKKQPFCSPPKHKYCFLYNNHETCPKGNACPHPHVSVTSVQGYTGGNSALNPKVPQNTIQTILLTPQTNPLQLTNDQSISTQIQVYSLTHYLQNYESELANFLLQGFTFGFKIPYKGPRQFRLSRNLSSIEGKEHILQQRIDQELKHQRIAGPFCKPPFPNIQISPLGLVPKNSPGEFRLIHHLSFPEKASINHHIPKEFCTVQYQSIHNAIEIIKQVGKGALLAKIDIENAYKQIPIHPSDFELLGFMINNQYYYDKTLPFGLSYSCNLFEKFSTALQWILTTKFGVQHCVHMLDDFLFIGAPSSPECYSSSLAFYVLAKDIGLPIKSEKTVYPTTILTFLGLELDTVQFQDRLPNGKLIQLQTEI